jgi:hypothetical protein
MCLFPLIAGPFFYCTKLLSYIAMKWGIPLPTAPPQDCHLENFFCFSGLQHFIWPKTNFLETKSNIQKNIHLRPGLPPALVLFQLTYAGPILISFAKWLANCNNTRALLILEPNTTEDGRFMNTFYWSSVNHRFSKSSYVFFNTIKFAAYYLIQFEVPYSREY